MAVAGADCSLEVTVEGGEQRHDRYLVVTGDETDVHRIKIPVAGNN